MSGDCHNSECLTQRDGTFCATAGGSSTRSRGRGTSPRSDGCDGVCVNLGCSEDCGEPDQSGRMPTPCPFCGHDLNHHDQPDCWDCTNAGTFCDSEVRDD